MNIIKDILSNISGWFRPHLLNISFAFAATLLIIYGARINKAVKQAVKPYPFYLRLLIFILIASFGYGALTVFFSKLLAILLADIGNLMLFPVICLMFVGVGLLAERRKHI